MSKEPRMAKKTRKKASKDVETLTHDEAKRANIIPTAEYQSVMEQGGPPVLRFACRMWPT